VEEGEIDLRLQAHAKFEAAFSGRDEWSHRRGRHRKQESRAVEFARMRDSTINCLKAREKCGDICRIVSLHDKRAAWNAGFRIGLQGWTKTFPGLQSEGGVARKCRMQHTLSLEICRTNCNLKCLFLGY